MKKSFASKFLQSTLYLFFIIGTCIVVAMPWTLDFYLQMLYDAYSVQENYHTFILIFLMIEGVLGLAIAASLISMVRTIESNPFVQKNVNILRRMGILGMVMAFLFFAKGWFYFTIMTFGCGLLLFLMGLFAFTLCDLLHQAVMYKEENDLTI